MKLPPPAPGRGGSSEGKPSARALHRGAAEITCCCDWGVGGSLPLFETRVRGRHVWLRRTLTHSSRSHICSSFAAKKKVRGQKVSGFCPKHFCWILRSLLINLSLKFLPTDGFVPKTGLFTDWPPAPRNRWCRSASELRLQQRSDMQLFAAPQECQRPVINLQRRSCTAAR